jgi:hypothetical protein
MRHAKLTAHGASSPRAQGTSRSPPRLRCGPAGSGIAQRTGFGAVPLLPGIWPSLHLDTAVTLPVGVECYAAYALCAWLATGRAVSDRTRRFARRSAVFSFALGMAGQVAFHLMDQDHVTRALCGPSGPASRSGPSGPGPAVPDQDQQSGTRITVRTIPPPKTSGSTISSGSAVPPGGAGRASWPITLCWTQVTLGEVWHFLAHLIRQL